ncbi:hypothetical protein MVEN_01760700 [Mycena venus]|uniref:Uncharacterized protein n=1 Tax=Mycena venus TaxID=2733690 RepID=A0A8H7CP91_9AGAR|nr:hypothetical protein MVEN_01760700 [Mycena venus]
MAAHRNGYFDCWKLEWWYGLGVILIVGGANGAVVVLCILGIKSHVQRNITIDRELLSRITADTPISGFYGPGSWWAWLITVGMTHVRTISAIRRTGKVPPGWNYDLLGVSAYVVDAAIDLILKSRVIAQLGATASESSILPALVCAERVVLVGSCSSFFSITMTLVFGDSWHIRTVGVAGFPVLLAIVASGFTWQAHQAIAQTAPIPWCNFHNNDTGGFPLFSMDSPVELGKLALDLSRFLLTQPFYWIGSAFLSCAPAAVVTYSLGEPAQRCSRRSVVQLLAILGTIALFPLLLLVFVGLAYLMIWPSLCLIIFWPVYIVSFFPQRGYLPPTAMSALDMDQAAALLTIVVVAAIRGCRPIFKAARSRFAPFTAASYELSPLLPVSADETSGN